MNNAELLKQIKHIQVLYQEAGREIDHLLSVLNGQVSPAGVRSTTPAGATRTDFTNKKPPASSMATSGEITDRQFDFMKTLVKERLDGNMEYFNAVCNSRYGKTATYLSKMEASEMIEQLKAGQIAKPAPVRVPASATPATAAPAPGPVPMPEPAQSVEEDAVPF
jgi:hypothetical protein